MASLCIILGVCQPSPPRPRSRPFLRSVSFIVTKCAPATLNDSWGYKPADQNWKSSDEVRRTRKHLRKLGVSYLLNVGPDGLGRIPATAAGILREARDPEATDKA